MITIFLVTPTNASSSLPQRDIRFEPLTLTITHDDATVTSASVDSPITIGGRNELHFEVVVGMSQQAGLSYKQ